VVIWRRGGVRAKGGRDRGARAKGVRDREVRGRGRVLARHSQQGDYGRIAPIFKVADPASQMMMSRVRSPMPVVSAMLIVMVILAVAVAGEHR
jgi:hypothetical protein